MPGERKSKLWRIGEEARARAVRKAIVRALRASKGNISAAEVALGLKLGNLKHNAEAAGITDLPALAKKYRPR